MLSNVTTDELAEALAAEDGVTYVSNPAPGEATDRQLPYLARARRISYLVNRIRASRIRNP